jgi:hypothetical protein
MAVKHNRTRKELERDELRDMWDKGGGGGDNRFDKTKGGKNFRRVLPKKDPDEPFFEKYAMHYNMGPDGTESFLCIEPGGPFGHTPKADKKRNYRAKKCGGCKRFCKNKTRSRKFDFGSKEGKKYWGKHVAPYRARWHFLFAVSLPKKGNKKAYVHKAGIKVAKPLIETYYDRDGGGGDFTDPENGRDIIITKKQLSKRATDVDYDVKISLERSKLKTWKKLRKKLPDLKTYIPEALDSDAIDAVMDGEGEDDRKGKKGKKRRDRDDDIDLDDLDDDEKEVRNVGKRKRGKDENVDPYAAEEDDDRKGKKKRKKSKLRDKLAKKARKD